MDQEITIIKQTLKNNINLKQSDRLFLVYQNNIDLCDNLFHEACKDIGIYFELRKFAISEFQNGNFPELIVQELIRDQNIDCVVLLMEWSQNTTDGRLKFLNILSSHAKDWKIVSMPGMTKEFIKFCHGNYNLISKYCKDLFKYLKLYKNIEIITYLNNREYRLFAKRSGMHNPIISDGSIKSGSWGNIPSGETFIIPDLESANGEIVINGSLPNRPLKDDEWVYLKIEKGVITRIKTSHVELLADIQSLNLNENLKSCTNNLAEIGFGANPYINNFTGNPLFDEKILNTVHLGFGANKQFGGPLNCKFHHDLVCKNINVILSNEEKYIYKELIKNNKLNSTNLYNIIRREKIKFDFDIELISNHNIVNKNGNLLIEIVTNRGLEYIEIKKNEFLVKLLNNNSRIKLNEIINKKKEFDSFLTLLLLDLIKINHDLG